MKIAKSETDAISYTIYNTINEGMRHMHNNRFVSLCAGLVLFLTVVGTVNAKTINFPTYEIKSLTRAFIAANYGDTIIVDKGVYTGDFFIESGVTLISRYPHKAILDGAGRKIVLRMGRGTSVSGFVIRNGTIGVFTKNSGVTIENCKIVRNYQTGIICVRHVPNIRNNIIAFNRASGIQGWDMRTSGKGIVSNTIAFNKNNGIALGGKCNVNIRNNIIAFNQGFGTKIDENTKFTVQLKKNNFYGNLWSLEEVPEGNYSFDPKFASPRLDGDFTVSSGVKCPECPPDEFPGVDTDAFMLLEGEGEMRQEQDDAPDAGSSEQETAPQDTTVQ